MERKRIPEYTLVLGDQNQIQLLNNWLFSEVRKGHRILKIYVNTNRSFSNVCAPVAAILDHYRAKGITIRVKFNRNKEGGDYAWHTKFNRPLSIEDEKDSEKSDKYYPFDKVWTFSTSVGVQELVSSFILKLRQEDIIKQGVIESVEWCLNEVMDNVLQHSNESKGYVMVQIFKQRKQFSFCVFDAGIGIYNSLKDTKHHPEKAIDAITMALQERVTRDEKIGQGNGLWGLTSIVKKTNGTMEISSCGAIYKWDHGIESTNKDAGFTINKHFGTSFIDVRLNYNKPIDISGILTDSQGRKYEPVDLWLESIEDDENNRYVIKVREQANGTGTRRSAEQLRNMVLNISNIQKKVVVLDFKGINIISSSFADELVGKIIAEKGFVFFTKAFRIVNLSESNSLILNRSVQQRMAQIYYDDKLSEI